MTVSLAQAPDALAQDMFECYARLNPPRHGRLPTDVLINQARAADRAILIGHGGPGGRFSSNLNGPYVRMRGYPTQFACQAGAPTFQMQCWAADPGTRVLVQGDPMSASTISRAARASCQPQVGFAQPVFSRATGSGTNAVVQIGVRPAPGAPNLAIEAVPYRLADGTVAVEYRALTGEQALSRFFQEGSNVQWGGVQARGGTTVGEAAGAARAGMGVRVAMVGGQLVLLVGTEVLMHYAEEYAGHADTLYNASQDDCACPFNADAATPYMVWSADYWQQVGYYYGACDEPPPDPRWFGSKRLPRHGTPEYDRALDRETLRLYGPDSFTWFIRSNRLDPTPIGYEDVPELVPVWRNPFDLRNPFPLRREQEYELVFRQRPLYGPAGWRQRFPLQNPACDDRRGGQIGWGGVDPPYEDPAPPEPETFSCACRTSGENTPAGSGMLALTAMCAAGGALARRRRRGERQGVESLRSSGWRKRS